MWNLENIEWYFQTWESFKVENWRLWRRIAVEKNCAKQGGWKPYSRAPLRVEFCASNHSSPRCPTSIIMQAERRSSQGRTWKVDPVTVCEWRNLQSIDDGRPVRPKRRFGKRNADGMWDRVIIPIDGTKERKKKESILFMFHMLVECDVIFSWDKPSAANITFHDTPLQKHTSLMLSRIPAVDLFFALGTFLRPLL